MPEAEIPASMVIADPRTIMYTDWAGFAFDFMPRWLRMLIPARHCPSGPGIANLKTHMRITTQSVEDAAEDEPHSLIIYPIPRQSFCGDLAYASCPSNGENFLCYCMRACNTRRQNFNLLDCKLAQV